MEYKIDDVAKLFETSNFAIYSYITRYPELRKSLQAKNGVLTINEVGVDLLHTYIKEEKNPHDLGRTNQPSADELYGEDHPDVTIRPRQTQPADPSDPASEPGNSEPLEAPPNKEASSTRIPFQETPFTETPRPASVPKKGPSQSPGKGPDRDGPDNKEIRPEYKGQGRGEARREAGEERQETDQTGYYQNLTDFQDRTPQKPIPEMNPGQATYREMKEALLNLRDQLDRKDRQIEDLSRMLENQQMILKQEQLNVKAMKDYLLDH